MRGDILGAAIALLCVTSAHAAVEAHDWRIERIDGVIIRTRTLEGGVTEYIAEGTLDACVQDVEEVLTRFEEYPRFMPYVEETKVLGKGEGGTTRVYTLLDFPMLVKSHDYVIDVEKLSSSKRSNEFRMKWSAVPDALPERDGVQRVPVNEGEWIVRGEGATKSTVIYRYAVSPGDKVPSWAEDFGRKDGVLKLFHRVEREASDRAFKRHYYGRSAAARR